MPAESPTADGPFIGRRQELEALRNQLLSDLDAATTSGVAVVRGMTGIGKTSLIREFIRKHRDAFPAGVCLTTPAFPQGNPDDAVMRQVADLVRSIDIRGDGLVVIDEAHRFDSTQATTMVAELRSRRPRARVIFVSSIPLSRRWSEIVLDGLPESDVEVLLREQLDLTDADIKRLASGMEGNPLLASLIAHLAARGEGVSKLLNRLQPATYSGLLGPDGKPLGPDSRPADQVTVGFRALNADLIARIEAQPEMMRELTPRQFEEFVAALYERHGFEVELTPTSKDGGVDLYAVRYEAFGRYLTVVDCKRFAPHRPIEVKLVRELYGVVQDKGASAGVLATTSSFTAGARQFQERHRYRLGLQDWFDLQDMLRGASTP